MKTKKSVALQGIVGSLILLFAGCVSAPPPNKHPAYLHAISDLRAARWMLANRPGGAAVTAHEEEAIVEVDHAINELSRAAIHDGKNLNNQPPPDAPADYRGRLHKAADLLRTVRADTHREEDNPNSVGLRDRALGHIDAALRETERAIHDVEAGR